MAGNIKDPSQWRLRTAGNDIPYKFLGVNGSFQQESGSVDFKMLVQAQNLESLLQEIFPPPLVVGNISIPQSATLPGLPALVAKDVKFRQFDDSMPVDPFQFDAGAAGDTYYPIIEVTINYGPATRQEPNADDPSTFLEISGSASGEFLTGGASSLQKVKESSTQEPDSTTGELSGDPTQEDPEPLRTPTAPVMMVLPETEWSVRWLQIPAERFRDVIVHRLRLLMGKVNSKTVPFLYNAQPETLLFVGYELDTEYTWRREQINAPPVSVEMKILEKRLQRNNVVRGHNHFWDEEENELIRLEHTDGSPLHESEDFNFLFQV